MKKFLILLSMVFITIFMSGCYSWLASSGPNSEKIHEIIKKKSNIQIVAVDEKITRSIKENMKYDKFSESFINKIDHKDLIGLGDTLQINIIEASPATLFGNSMINSRGIASTNKINTLPQQLVQYDGTINVPFAGYLKVENLTISEIEALITKKLKGKANDPQVLIQRVNNSSNTVTVIGEVFQNKKVPLSPNNKKILDILATCGGAKQEVSKVTLQVNRNEQIKSMTLSDIIKDPKQNIIMKNGDILTALYKPFSFTVLGAVGRNNEYFFETQSISLAKGLARTGGLQENKANPEGVFIFRLEDENAMKFGKTVPRTPEGKIPVIYQVNLNDPSGFFIAQSFPIKNNDIVYVSHSISSDIQKFMNILTSAIYTIATPISMGLTYK